MTYSLITGGEHWTQVATVGGFAEFRDWAEKLKTDDYKQVRHLVAYGWSQELEDLGKQLQQALKDKEPSDDVADIGRTILKALDNRTEDAESAILTDGMTEKDDPDDSGWTISDEDKDKEPDNLRAGGSDDAAPLTARLPITRKQLHDLHLKRHGKAEKRLIATLEKYFADVIDDVAKAIGKVNLTPTPEAAAQQAAAIIDEIWPDAETDKQLESLVVAVKDDLTAAFFDGAMTEVTLAKYVLQGRTKGTKTTAADIVEELGLDWSDYPTEPPAWLIEAANESITEAFQQDYWQEIIETTGGDVETRIRRGIEDGLSIRDLAASITELNRSGYPKVRATRIARTESTQALSAGHAAGITQTAEETGLPMGLEWLSVFGSTSREDHMQADGQQVPVDGEFDIGGEKARWPGDHRLSAKQRIACQCSLLSTAITGELESATPEEVDEATPPKAETIEEAQAWATGKIADKVDFTGIEDVRVANKINEVLAEQTAKFKDVKIAGIKLGRLGEGEAAQTFISRTRIAGEHGWEDGPVGYVSITLNENDWRSVSSYRQMQALVPNGSVVDNSPGGVLRHEFGHALDAVHGDQKLTKRIYRDTPHWKKDQLSTYANWDEKELTAELFVHWQQHGSDDLKRLGFEAHAKMFERWEK